MLIGILAVFALAIALRYLPVALSPHGIGVDNWYWLQYVEESRRQRRFPPVLERYLLDEAQWYPPVFPLLLLRLPKVILERYSWTVALILDLVRMALLLVVADRLFANDWATLAAGVIYATTPLLISYNSQLNPRCLGGLLLDLLVAILLLGPELAPVAMWGTAAVLVSGLILLTHKMTTQLFWFGCMVAALWLREPLLLALIPASFAAAYVLSLGFYRQVLIAHWDILKFWNRNWRWIGANPLQESPVYGQPGYHSPSKYFRPGLGPWFKRLQVLVGANNWAYAAVLLYALLWLMQIPPTPAQTTVTGLLLIVLAFAFLTTLVPPFRTLGQGYLYMFNTVAPASLSLAALFAAGLPRIEQIVVLALGLAANIAALVVYLRMLVKSSTWRVDPKLDALVGELARLPAGVVMCLPITWADYVTYRTHHRVVWGGHGLGFERLQPVFPRMCLSAPQLVQQYRINYLVAQKNYLPENFIADLPPHTRREVAGHSIFIIAPAV